MLYAEYSCVSAHVWRCSVVFDCLLLPRLSCAHYYCMDCIVQQIEVQLLTQWRQCAACRTVFPLQMVVMPTLRDTFELLRKHKFIQDDETVVPRHWFLPESTKGKLKTNYMATKSAYDIQQQQEAEMNAASTSTRGRPRRIRKGKKQVRQSAAEENMLTAKVGAIILNGHRLNEEHIVNSMFNMDPGAYVDNDSADETYVDSGH
jgi:hypothetical protein